MYLESLRMRDLGFSQRYERSGLSGSDAMHYGRHANTAEDHGAYTFRADLEMDGNSFTNVGMHLRQYKVTYWRHQLSL
jgi:hypothetical protein